MSTTIKLHAIGPTISHEDLKCFRQVFRNRECTELRRPGSFYDSEILQRIYDEVHDGKDIGPCGHYAAIEEGDRIEIGEDTWEPNDAVRNLFPWRYGTRVLTKELVYEIVQVGLLRGAGDYNDRKVINWLSRHIGAEVFCVSW